MEIITTESGHKMQWQRTPDNILGWYRLNYCETPEKLTGCGNPFNLLTEEERTYALSIRPKRAAMPCQTSTIVENRVISIEELH